MIRKEFITSLIYYNDNDAVISVLCPAALCKASTTSPGTSKDIDLIYLLMSAFYDVYKCSLKLRHYACVNFSIK